MFLPFFFKSQFLIFDIFIFNLLSFSSFVPSKAKVSVEFKKILFIGLGLRKKFALISS